MAKPRRSLSPIHVASHSQIEQLMAGFVRGESCVLVDLKQVFEGKTLNKVGCRVGCCHKCDAAKGSFDVTNTIWSICVACRHGAM